MHTMMVRMAALCLFVAGINLVAPASAADSRQGLFFNDKDFEELRTTLLASLG